MVGLRVDEVKLSEDRPKIFPSHLDHSQSLCEKDEHWKAAEAKFAFFKLILFKRRLLVEFEPVVHLLKSR